MSYKKKLITLSAVAAILALVYIASFVFDPARRGGRAFAWLDPAHIDLVSALEIYGPAGVAVLRRELNVWYFADGGLAFPVKQGRVEDFIAALSRRDVYSRRAVSVEGRERLGLAEGRASRVIARGGAGLPLLDLLLGTADALERELYMRRAGETEIYSGEDHLTYYTDSAPESWYDLRLFRPAVESAAVQQVEISRPEPGPGEWEGTGFVPGPPREYVIGRSGTGWIIAGNESGARDALRTEAWLRSVLEVEGEGFAAGFQAHEGEGSVTLHLGDGTSLSLRVGPEDEQKQRLAKVTGTELIYTLSESTVNRLFWETPWY